jgi:hypothetical protein
MLRTDEEILMQLTVEASDLNSYRVQVHMHACTVARS